MIDDAAEARSLVQDHNPARWLANDGHCHIVDAMEVRKTYPTGIGSSSAFNIGKRFIEILDPRQPGNSVLVTRDGR
ncbi:hypothetical protein [Bradyrhizobium sp. CCBAU 45321]|uniref:hypothetical protein n=1 Tax=Bradyrhizobium sp. CCBAU 45321 TaxID=1641878 RepID=UPI002302D8E7|nr:hypothetical protein [Bradyrhizobium sp. CCBAU 45321]